MADEIKISKELLDRLQELANEMESSDMNNPEQKAAIEAKAEKLKVEFELPDSFGTKAPVCINCGVCLPCGPTNAALATGAYAAIYY